MKVWLVLLGTLPLMAVGSGAVAGTSSAPPQNGLIAIQGSDGIYVVEPESGTARALPGTTEMGEPAWSPDGRLLAVEQWADDGTSNVYTMKPDGTDRQLVLRNASFPSWSPDGKRLAVVRDTCTDLLSCDGDGQTILATVGTDGGDAEQINVVQADDMAGAADPAWSPDGSSIAFVGPDGGVYLVNADGKGELRTLAKSGFDLSWSPDGSKLAFDRFLENGKSSRQVVVVLDVKTGKETILLGQQTGAQSPAWSPDGQQLAFLSHSPEVAQTGGGCGEHFDARLWSMAPDGTKAHRILKDTFIGTPTWEPALEPKTTPSDEPQATRSDPPLVHKTADAARPRTDVQPLPAPKPARTDGPARPAAPSSADRPLSTKNGLIAARGPGGIYLIDPAGGNVLKAPDTADLDRPVWSPTGRLLALERVEGGISSVYTINRRGSQRRLVVKDASAPMWSADGQRLFVVRGSCVAPEGCEATADDSVLLSVRPDGTDVRQVDYEDVDASQAGWPVDGNWIAFLEDSGVDVANPTSVDSSAAAWSPDATKLAFASSSGVRPEGAAADEARGLWVIDANGGKPELVAKGSYQSLSWGPAAQPRSSD